MKLPLKKSLWKQIVQAKIKTQAKVLRDLSGGDAGLGKLWQRVRSGDPDNIETQAARRYWPRLFSAEEEFKRDREGDDQNHFLNYGYAILRALTARNLCATGLHPSLGLHHHNRYSAYCLADDLMEPFRPWVDLTVFEVTREHSAEATLDAGIRQHLLSVIKHQITIDGARYSLQDALQVAARSLSAAVMGETKHLSLPDA